MVSIATLGTHDVERFLHDRYEQVAEVEPLAGGEWSRAFAFTSRGRRLVMRFGHHAQVHAKDRFAAERWGEALPVPAVLDVGDACDGVYAVARHASGTPIDLLAGNVLAEDGRITAVLDWGNSLAGDPLYDVAWLRYWAPWHPGLDPSGVRHLADDLLTGDHVEERLRTYELHIALDHQQYWAWRGSTGDLEWNTTQAGRLLDS